MHLDEQPGGYSYDDDRPLKERVKFSHVVIAIFALAIVVLGLLVVDFNIGQISELIGS